MQILKDWGWAIALVIAMFALVGGGSGASLGGSTSDNFSVGIGQTATSTITIENGGAVGGCIKIKQSDGSGYGFMTITPGGNWATSTTSC